MDITDLMALSVKHNASDLHLCAGMSPVIRIDGEMQKLDLPAWDDQHLRSQLLALLNDPQQARLAEQLSLDLSLEFASSARFRVNIFEQSRGIAAAFRTIPSHIVSLAQLNAPAILQQIVQYPRGLILVTGPTGSGKSTTLAAMVDYLNQHFQHHILTIEDPIEFIHTSKQSLINQRELHQHTHSFEDALRSALREDPDVILVGEMRDLATIRLALTAAETGHLVLASLHTASAAKTIDRIVDAFAGAEKTAVRAMLSESLRAVISQTLLKKIGAGRVAAHEIMIATPAVRNLIREDKLPQLYSTIQTSSNHGMQTMDQSLQKLLKQGIISIDEAKKHAQDRHIFNL